MKKNNLCLLAIQKMLDISSYLLRNSVLKATALFLIVSMFFAGCKLSDKKDSEPISPDDPNGSVSMSVSTALPGGRAYYVVSVMGGPTNNKFCRLARYTFNTAGTVTEQFYFWDQTFTGDAYTNKVSTGYTTNGCPHGPCTVKTPLGFQPGTSGTTLSGTYYLDVNGRVVITWTGGSVETWTVTNPAGKAYTKLTIFNSNYNLAHGYGFGSNSPFSSFATAAQMKAAGSLTNFVYWENKGYGSADSQNTTAPFYLGTFSQCSNTLTGPETATGPCDRYASYIAASGTGNLRKAYWNHQKGSVRCDDGGEQECISPQGGHTTALLQIIDDAGAFQGFVGAEASLHSLSPACPGCAIIGSMFWTKP